MKLEIILSILNIKHVNILGKKFKKLVLRRLWSKLRLKFSKRKENVDVWWSIRGNELFLKNGGLRIKLY